MDADQFQPVRISWPARLERAGRWLALGLAVYVLSSGPVLAIAFWLREATGRDEFYAALYGYYPLLVLPPAPAGPLGWYIEWWVNLLGTVGPG